MGRPDAAVLRGLIRVVSEVLLRPGLRVGELIGLGADTVVLIGDVHWLHVPVGKLHDDRYLPLHPHLITLIGELPRCARRPVHPLLLQRENGTLLHRHTITRMLNLAARAAGIGHVHPHQMRHTWPPSHQPSMSLLAVAAMVGHHSMDMTATRRSPPAPSPSTTSQPPRSRSPRGTGTPLPADQPPGSKQPKGE
jgi:integrase